MGRKFEATALIIEKTKKGRTNRNIVPSQFLTGTSTVISRDITSIIQCLRWCKTECAACTPCLLISKLKRRKPTLDAKRKVHGGKLHKWQRRTCCFSRRSRKLNVPSLRFKKPFHPVPRCFSHTHTHPVSICFQQIKCCYGNFKNKSEGCCHSNP